MMSSTKDKDLSLAICSSLDTFGFNKKQIVSRSNLMDELGQIMTIKLGNSLNDTIVLAVGSAGEGVKLSESDNDFMFVFSHVICVDEGIWDSDLTVLETDYSNTAPGYTKVVARSISVLNIFPFILLLQCRNNQALSGRTYTSNENNRDICNLINSTHCCYQKLNVTGPAMTSSHTDIAFSIYFYGGNHLRRWTNRLRNFVWPSSEVVKEVSQMEGYIVPVGEKQSEMQAFEWRICYTTAEKKLVSSLSGTQVKVYVLLKKMAKSILKPKCIFLTSYVVKNVIFWVFEMTQSCQLLPNYLVYLIQKAIYFIKRCIINNHLPNYMIPERNLLRGAVSGEEKLFIISFLSDCLDEGSTILLKIPSLYDCISLTISKPDVALAFKKWRDDAEYLVLRFASLYYSHCDSFDMIRTSANDGSFAKILSSNILFKACNEALKHIMPDVVNFPSARKSAEYVLKVYKEREKLLNIL